MSAVPQRLYFLRKKAALLFFLLGRVGRHGWGQFWTGLRHRNTGYLAMEMAPILPREASVIVDVGGHTGDCAAAFDFLYRPKTLIVVEPNANQLAALRARFAGHPAVEIVNNALSDRPGEVIFHTYAFDAASSLFVCRPGHLQELGFSEVHAATKVVAITLAQLLAERNLTGVDLLKLDCQGAELAILRGAGASLHGVRAIYTEVAFEPIYESAPLFAEVHAHLLGQDFNLVHLGEFAGKPGHIQWGDALYLNRRFSPA